MTNKEFVLDTMKRYGVVAAQNIQVISANISGTELNAEKGFIPSFIASRSNMNMLKRKAGQTDGFVCQSSAGRVVRLIQTYDSDIYQSEPEKLPAQWRFVWSTNPVDALPFVSIATSPYATDDCCTHNGHIWKSGQNNNIWAPGTPNIKWTDLGEINNWR